MLAWSTSRGQGLRALQTENAALVSTGYVGGMQCCPFLSRVLDNVHNVKKGIKALRNRLLLLCHRRGCRGRSVSVALSWPLLATQMGRLGQGFHDKVMFSVVCYMAINKLNTLSGGALAAAERRCLVHLAAKRWAWTVCKWFLSCIH